MAKAVAKRKYIDWDSIEPLYRAGAMSLNDICCQYALDHIHSQTWKTEVTHSTISKYAKDHKWTKNLAAKVKDRIQEKLTTGLATSCGQSDEEVIEAAAKEPVAVALGQRARTHRLLKDQDDLAAELRANADGDDLMTRIRGFKDIAASVKTHHADQAEQYKLTDQVSTDKTRIKVARVSADE